MVNGYTKRLPGIQFEAKPPQQADILPRMDIAAFVGFASAGPLHTPVIVEDMVRFRDIFGEDLALAWDPETENVENAYLASAVEAFFRNGGRRCWVVRVAENPETNQFPLPSLFSAPSANSARNNSQGSN